MVPARYRNNPFTPMNFLLEEFFGDMIPERTSQAGFRPPLDLREDEGHFYAQLELPGMSKEEVKISIEDSVLTCLLYTSPSPRDATLSRMPSSA